MRSSTVLGLVLGLATQVLAHPYTESGAPQAVLEPQSIDTLKFLAEVLAWDPDHRHVLRPGHEPCLLAVGAHGHLRRTHLPRAGCGTDMSSHQTSVIKPVPDHLGDLIIDQDFVNKDGKIVAAYDTFYTQMLAKGPDKAKPRYNADNYAMFAREVYFTKNCPLIKYKDPEHWESGVPNNLRPHPPPAATLEL